MQGNTPVECEILNVIQGAGIWPDCDDKTQLLQAIEALISGGGSGGGGVIAGSEIGSVSAFAMPTPPTGWLVCDGTAISRTEYADLFATIGTLWGQGDQVSTFNLPDLRGEFVRGFDAGRGVDAGRVFGAAQDTATNRLAQVEMHNDGAETPLITIPQDGSWSDRTMNIDDLSGGNNRALRFRLTGDETRPRNIAMIYAIKAFYPTSA
jgi:phage-related tail fiber protein